MIAHCLMSNLTLREEDASDRAQELHHLFEQQHATIYREHPFLAAPDFSARLRQLINTPAFRQILLLDS